MANKRHSPHVYVTSYLTLPGSMFFFKNLHFYIFFYMKHQTHFHVKSEHFFFFLLFLFSTWNTFPLILVGLALLTSQLKYQYVKGLPQPLYQNFLITLVLSLLGPCLLYQLHIIFMVHINS